MSFKINMRKMSLLIRLFVGFVIIYALFSIVPYQELKDVYKHSQKIYFLYSYMAFFSCYFVALSRWKYILGTLGVKVSFHELIYSSFSGLFLNLFFPSFIAGDIFRGFSISFRHGDIKKVTSSILMGRFSGIIALAFIAFLSYGLGRNLLGIEKTLIPVLVLCILACALFVLMMFKPALSFIANLLSKNSRMKDRIVAWQDQLYHFQRNPSVFVVCIFLSLFIHVVTSLGFYMASKAFHVDVSVTYFLIIIPIVMAVTFIPITVAGIGTREVAAVYFFSAIGITKSVALGISLLNLGFILLMGILGGIVYILIYHEWLVTHAEKKIITQNEI